jgi:ribulose 1,5-bisphosphate synthetase/thiazole synthase
MGGPGIHQIFVSTAGLAVLEAEEYQRLGPLIGYIIVHGEKGR